jgi:hypothetical protein
MCFCKLNEANCCDEAGDRRLDEKIVKFERERRAKDGEAGKSNRKISNSLT